MAEFNPLRDPILGKIKEVEVKSFGEQMIGEENFFSLAIDLVDKHWALAGNKMSVRGEWLRRVAIQDIIKASLSSKEFINEVK
jgi:hypothetical protein